jgi:hypothetical protein
MLDVFVESLFMNVSRYRPVVGVAFIEKELAFKDHHECIAFLESKGVRFNDHHKKELDTKSSYPILAQTSHLYDKIDIKGQI